MRPRRAQSGLFCQPLRKGPNKCEKLKKKKSESSETLTGIFYHQTTELPFLGVKRTCVKYQIIMISISKDKAAESSVFNCALSTITELSLFRAISQTVTLAACLYS